MCKQILPTSNIRNTWRTVRRTYMLILRLKGLNFILDKYITRWHTIFSSSLLLVSVSFPSVKQRKISTLILHSTVASSSFHLLKTIKTLFSF